MPKLAVLLQVVPDPVAGAYIFIFIALLFRQGVGMVTTGGFGYEKGLIVCTAFWLGLGFQHGAIFPDNLPDWSRVVPNCDSVGCTRIAWCWKRSVHACCGTWRKTYGTNSATIWMS